MNEDQDNYLDSIGGFLGSLLAGSQGYDPQLGHWAGRTATKFTRSLFSSSSHKRPAEEVLSRYAALFRHMAASDGGLDAGRLERIVRVLTVLNAHETPSLDALTLRRIAADGLHQGDMINALQQELTKDIASACLVLELCFKWAAMDIVITESMAGCLHELAMRVGLPQDRISYLMAVYYRPQPDEARRIRAAATLGLISNATRDEIDTAFTKLSTPYHPDRTHGLSPEIAALTIAKYQALREAHDSLLIPTEWWARAPDRLEAIALQQQLSVACFACGRSVTLPPSDLLWIARCPDCLLLLLHAKETIEIFVGQSHAAKHTGEMIVTVHSWKAAPYLTVLKALRSATGFGLQEAKRVVDNNVPAITLTADKARRLVAALKEIHVDVEIHAR